MKDTIEKRLDDLIRDFDELLGRHDEVEPSGIVETSKKLVSFGLTIDEAKAWLSNEPNYIGRRKVTGKRNSRRGTRTLKSKVY